jgi:carbon-monoxide dehydrogenase medium subunit
VKPSDFRYVVPATVEEAVTLLDQDAVGTKLLAGGQSLVPMMNFRLATPSIVVDLNHIPGLRFVSEEAGVLSIGAMTRHFEVAGNDLVAKRLPLLAHAAALIGYPAIRNRGTIGGSLAHADPAAEMPLVALTLDAEFVAVGPTGERTIQARDFFDGFFTTALAPAEVLTEIRFDIRGSLEAWAFEELARKTGDFAIAAAAVAASLDGGVVRRLRVGIGGASDRPVRANRLETLLIGKPVSAARDTLKDGSARVAIAADNPGNAAGDRWEVATILAERALATVLAHPGGNP